MELCSETYASESWCWVGVTPEVAFVINIVTLHRILDVMFS